MVVLQFVEGASWRPGWSNSEGNTLTEKYLKGNTGRKRRGFLSKHVNVVELFKTGLKISRWRKCHDEKNNTSRRRGK